jgi:large subunit ribosomal protein L23
MTHIPKKYVDVTEDLSWVLAKPVLSEKAARLGSEENVYTFDVDQRANKTQIKKAVQTYYKVSAQKVNIIVSKPATKVFRGRRGQTTGGKKAMIFLKKGDTINFA